MTSSDPQAPWTDEQWALVRQAVLKEANRSRVAATFLPLYGPLPGDTDFVKSEKLEYSAPSTASSPPPEGSQTMSVDDQDIIHLATLQVRVFLRGAQVADPRLTSALEMFRRASNVLARLEDAIVFRGQTAKDHGPEHNATKCLPAIWTVRGGQAWGGLLGESDPEDVDSSGAHLVQQVSKRIGRLESAGHFGPFAVVLGEALFAEAQTPTGSLVLPSDRIIPFLGGGPLLRSSTLPDDEGIVIALGSAPVELVVATDVSVGFLQVNTDPQYVFRVFEKIAVRIKERGAIQHLKQHKPVPPAK
jgi:uncharacterized linocin/CFP29 family protein